MLSFTLQVWPSVKLAGFLISGFRSKPMVLENNSSDLVYFFGNHFICFPPFSASLSQLFTMFPALMSKINEFFQILPIFRGIQTSIKHKNVFFKYVTPYVPYVDMG